MSAAAGSPPATVRRDLLLLLAGCAVLFGAGLGARDLWNPNEPIYGEAVKEMVARGSFAVPYVNGLTFAEKPILYYWLALAAAKLFGGVGETTLRLPSLVAGASVVAGTYLLALPYRGRRVALVAAAATATSYEMWWVSRGVQMDVLATAATLGVVLALTRVLDQGLAPWKGWLAAGAIAGAGLLAKGPVTWICPGLVLGVYAAWTGRIRTLFARDAWLGLVAAAAVAAPWPLWLATHGRADVLQEVFVRQNFERFTSPWDHVAPPWYYVPYFFVDMAPWSFLSVLAWKSPGDDESRRRILRLAATWIVVIVAFFSLSKSKRDPYIVPVAPAAAILAAEVVVAFVDGTLSRARRLGVDAVAGFIAIGLGGLAVALVGPIARKHPEVAGPSWILAAAAGAGAVALLAALVGRRHRGWALPGSLFGATAAVYLTLALVALPALDTYKSARPVAERLAAIARPEDRLASFNFWAWRAEYRYYLDRPIENLPDKEALRAAWSGSERVVLLVKEPELSAARSVIGDAAPAFERRVGASRVYVFTSR